MKLKEGFLLKEIAGEYALFPVGQNIVDFRNIVAVNETGRFVVEKLQTELSYQELLADFLKEYEAADENEKEQMQYDLDRFLDNLWRHEMLCM